MFSKWNDSFPQCSIRKWSKTMWSQDSFALIGQVSWLSWWAHPSLMTSAGFYAAPTQLPGFSLTPSLVWIWHAGCYRPDSAAIKCFILFLFFNVKKNKQLIVAHVSTFYFTPWSQYYSYWKSTLQSLLCSSGVIFIHHFWSQGIFSSLLHWCLVTF